MNRCLASRRGGRKKLLCVILAALGGAGFLALALLHEQATTRPPHDFAWRGP